MRVNIYEEEVTDEVKLVSTTPETGRTFWGARIFLKSANELHHTLEDDDRSAVTFWLHNQEKAAMYFERIAQSIRAQIR